jgi:hypothetical protein
MEMTGFITDMAVCHIEVEAYELKTFEDDIPSKLNTVYKKESFSPTFSVDKKLACRVRSIEKHYLFYSLIF